MLAVHPGDFKQLYGDAVSLSRTFKHSGTAYCNRARAIVPVRVGALLFAGFPCTDVSRINNLASSSDNKDIILAKAGNTGSCFWAIIVMLDSAPDTLVCILENVPGLRDYGRLNQCRAALKLINFILVDFDLDPLQFEIPHDRPRVWMIAFRVSALAISAGDVRDS